MHSLPVSEPREPLVREAELTDLPYFARAAKTFIKDTIYTLDPEIYLDNMVGFIMNPEVGLFVTGEPSGHCGVVLVESMYGDETVARVVTTWGKGGLICFKHAEQWAKDRGAKYLMADSLHEPRIRTFYERNGMTQTDILYMKGL